MYRIFDSDWTAHYSRSAVFTKMLWQKSMFAIFFCILISLDPPWMDVIAVQRTSVHVREMRTQGSFAIGLKILKVHYCSIKIKYLQLS